jgi:hypothetical protein
MEHTSAEVARRQSDGTWKYAIDNPYGGEVLRLPQLIVSTRDSGLSLLRIS